jgi:hypothetical protein
MPDRAGADAFEGGTMFGDEERQGAPTRAIRLTLAQDGDNLKVLSRQSVRMRVPESDPTYGLERKSGFWVELRSAAQECVYRRAIPNPLDEEIEAPSGDPERPFTRATVSAKQRVFVVLVPDTDAGREIVLMGSPRGARGGTARPLAAIDLRKPDAPVRKIAGGDDRPARSARKRPAGKSRSTRQKGGR